LIFVSTIVSDGQLRASKAPRFLAETVYAILHLAKPFTSQANGGAKKLKELIKNKIIGNC
jgi:hypothetical protein